MKVRCSSWYQSSFFLLLLLSIVGCGGATSFTNAADPVITWDPPASIPAGTPLTAAQLNATANVPGTFTFSPSVGTVLPPGTNTLTVTFTPVDASKYNRGKKNVKITVGQLTPTITWNAPASIPAGTALSSAQLNATANAPGTFTYSPAAGTVLSAGTYKLSTTFTPTDLTAYTTATASVSITVVQATLVTPVISWAAPAPIAAGTALSSAQLNASANVPGSFAYSPAVGTVLSPGAHTLTATFTPTDMTTYTTATASVSITVGQATPVISWAAPAPIAAGTALGSAQLNASANVPGTFAYNPAAGTVLSAGAHTLTATFTPTDTTTYKTATASVSITVGQATPVITWNAPAPIATGTALSSAQLNASANVPGTFAYSPAAGAVLPVGTNTLTATFTPTDTTTYKTATASVSITVGQATPVISWNNPASISVDTALSSAQLNASANVPGTFAYSPAAGTMLTAGTHTLTATFTPTDTTTYKTSSSSVSITVNKGTPVITWNAPPAIVTGTALSANELNASANLPGSFVYNPAAGTVLTVGTNTLATTFTPNDTANYSVATASNSITVTSGTPPPTGPVVNVNPSMSTQQIQTALNGAPSGATVSFAAGNYNINAPITVPCANLALSGPVSDPPTATLSASFTNNVILNYNGGCSSLGAIRYLGFANTGAVYFSVGNNGNFTFEHNKVSNLPSNLSNLQSESGLYFDGNLSTKLSNILVQYNTFGDSNSCSAIFAMATDMGGYCAGIMVSQGESNKVTIQNNIFEHVEEGVHFNQLQDWNPGAQDSVCVSCTIDTNYIAHYHRIGIEIQVDTPTDSIMLEHNSIIDPVNSSWGTFAVSMACCQWGRTMATPGYSPAFVFNDNLLIASLPCGAECPPFGVEFWGTGPLGTNSLIEGSFFNGYTWGYGGGAWAINNNYICGPNYPSMGGYISNEEHQTNPPAQSGNVTVAQCQTHTSTAPTIGPGGSFTTSQVVTLSDSGPNTGIWYTTDGSAPIPGAGTAKLYTGPFTISSTTVVKAVGMWGAANQPKSYPAGYGYVPSAVVTATFTQN